MDDDQGTVLFARHYGPFIILCAVVGASAGLAYATLVGQTVSASAIVVEGGGAIAVRQFGPVAENVFSSAAVMAPAAQKLGLSRSELAEAAELDPVPESDTVLVIGRASEIERAKAVSGAVAEALVEALNEQTRIEASVFAPPELARNQESLAKRVAVALGAAVGFWLALSLSIAHYRWKRPLLTIREALRVSQAEMVAVVDGRWPSWLGFLRPALDWTNTEPNRFRLARLRELAGPSSYVHLDMGSIQTKSRQRLLARHGAELQKGSQPSGAGSHNGLEVRIIAADAGTAEHVLATSNLMGGDVVDVSRKERIGLVWVR